MLKIILGVVLLAVLAVLGLAATKPDTFQVQRSTTVKAPPDKIFPLINDFRRWTEWSPWEALDPAMQRTHSGAASGQGAIYAWEGNKAVGAGRMEILQADVPTKLRIKLDFIRPFEGHNTTDFTLAPAADSANPNTTVTWLMQGPTPFVSKLMQVFVSMDSLIGKDFEAGLGKMKTVAER